MRLCLCSWSLATLALRARVNAFTVTLPTKARCSSGSGGGGGAWRALSATAYGQGMDQNAMMESDMLIIVDEKDVVQDVVYSKKEAHGFNHDQPRGVLHRAFSFFLFNTKNELLLTRRADSKITFPGVWTNTACSHPLRSMVPDEVDPVPAAYPAFPKTKHAVTRKLFQELGIASKDLPHEKIVFVSRFHYWAADTVSSGPESPWGEHEVDYIFFLKVEDEEPELNINPDEVAEYKYVSIDEIKTMFEDPSLKWSPWFRGIMERGGFQWWEDLGNTLEGKYTTDQVDFFDPPPEHYAVYNLPSHDRFTGVYRTDGSVTVKATLK